MAAQAASNSKGVVCVAPPSSGGPYTKYLCTPCYKGACLQGQLCTATNRRRQLLAPVNPCDSYTGTVSCFLTNLESITPYE